MRFNIVTIIPSDRYHWLHAYDEVIETVAWGIKELGHTVTHGINRFEMNSVNILFGHRLIPVESLAEFPRNTIVYNLEQIKGLAKEDILRNESNRYCIENFQIWEYCDLQKSIWESLNPKFTPHFVKIGYAPPLTRIPKRDHTIDVLLYGETTNDRLRIYHQLSQAGIKSVYLCGIFGQLRNELIAQSKIILNINKYTTTKIFEIVRVSFLLANRKCVMSDSSTLDTVDDDIRDAVCFMNTDHVVEECSKILNSESERLLLEERGYRAIVQRDIREILKSVL